MSLSIGTLFSSMGNSFAGSSYSNGLYGALSEYSSIKSGAYRKLLNTYYSGDNNHADKAHDIKKPSAVTTERKQLASVKDAADDLYESAAKLTDTSNYKNLFKNADSVTEDIASAVKKYAADYNSLIEEASDTTNKKVTGKVSFMTSQTSAYKNALSEIGITINDDKTLTVNEDTLKKADVNDVKNLFNGSSSMAYQTFVRASSISSAAEYADNSAMLYNDGGAYSGSYFNSSYNWYL